MKCYNHPDREAVGVCVTCGKAVCTECRVELGGKLYCNSCADKAFSNAVDTRASAAENTSGMGGMATVPPEVRGWNWGAFLLSWIWGIGNNVWIAFLTFIPYFGFIWDIVLGAKGSEWAWRSKRWDSIEHFKRTQSSWAKWGIVFFVVNIAIMLFLALLLLALVPTTSITSSF